MKILIIRFSSIGDIVLTSPVVRALKQQVADCEIHYLTKLSYAPIVSPSPYITKVYTIESGVSEIADRLKMEHYDCVIDLHNNLRSRQVRAVVGKKTYAVGKLNIEKWLLVNFKINILPPLHIVDRYLKTVAPLGVKPDGKGLDFFVSESEHESEEVLPPLFTKGYIGFVIGAKQATKKFPVSKVIDVCRLLSLPIVLIGGKEDAREGAAIAAAIGDKVLNRCGTNTLAQSALLVKNAAVVISNDTGLMHIAAAFNKKIVSLWGNTVPEFGMYPYLPLHPENSVVIENKHLSCRPCSKIGYSKCPKQHFKCMKGLDAATIAKAVQQLLDS